MQKKPQGSFLNTMANLISCLFFQMLVLITYCFSFPVSAPLFQLSWSPPVSACHICSTNHTTYSWEGQMLMIGTYQIGPRWTHFRSMQFFSIYLPSRNPPPSSSLYLLCSGNEHSVFSIRSSVSEKSTSDKTQSSFSSRQISHRFQAIYTSCRCPWSWYSFNPVRMTFQSQVNTQHSCTL